MSNLQPEQMFKHMTAYYNHDLIKKGEDIFRDKQFFQPYTYEEDDRPVKREKLNTRLLTFLKEARKIVSLNEVFNDISLWMSLLT